MKLVVFGATGDVGSRVVTEAISRGHDVTAAVRNEAGIENLPKGAKPIVANVADPAALAAAMAGQDLAVSAVRAPAGREGEVVALTRSILDAASLADLRVIIVGGAARLHLPDGSPHTVLTDPDFLPESIVPTARASMAQWELCSSDASANWTYASPSALLQPGERLGVFRTDTDNLIVDDAGNSKISMEDFAVAIVDEAQSAKFLRAAFTVGY
ncbi:NAD(P)H-binding protein [Ruegeria sp. SCSIO 43209]|uniref:NAD(P)-dependent oxidoreductase n=1 Tax=Ruegeria sp. SCSIO 43209 TaxID=2793010 RepID=UPI001CA9B641|nr:NAD(P)H-binding protein [Ruegeria sp. SCSIO 43209]UAB88233.1 NAD(P)H-binding protein [Ruegeria sp. SCSIO 43209]